MRVLIGLGLSLGALQCSGGPSSPQLLYHNKLQSLDGLITKDGLSLDAGMFQGRGNGIRIEAHGPTSIRLAEVQTKRADTVVLTYRGHLRAARLTGRGFLEMRCSIPGKPELVSRALDTAVSGTGGWVTQVAQLSLGHEQRPQTVRLNVQIEGSGTVWVQNVLLAQATR